EGVHVRIRLERSDDDRGDLGEVVLVEPAHRRRRRADADAGGDHRRALVERDRVAVDGQPAGLHPLLRGEARPVGGAQGGLVEVTKCECGTGLGCSPAATSPAKWAISVIKSAPTSSAISRKRSASTVRGYAEPPHTISFGRTSFAFASTSS